MKARRRCRHTTPVCAAAGWQLGTATLTTAGTLTCPLCDRPVTARHVRAGVVEVAPHPPAEAVTCRCGTTHAQYQCPACGRRLPAADAVLHHLALLAVEKAG